LARERDFFIDVVAGNKRERILGTEHQRPRDSVTGNSDAAHENSVLVERNPAGRAIERRAQDGHDRQAGRRTESDDAAGRAELIDVGRKQIRKAYADERTGRGVANSGWKMLLDDEPGRARSERVLVAAEIRGGTGLRDTAGNIERARRRSVDAPNREHIAFAIGHGNHAVRRNLEGSRRGMVDDRLDIDGRELRLGQEWPEEQAGNGEESGAESHGARFHTKFAWLRL